MKGSAIMPYPRRTPGTKSKESLEAIQTIHHQFRTKIGIVTGSIDILQHSEKLSSEGQADLSRMKRACEEMLSMLEILLAPSAPPSY
jgi:signal transduction histidine kinase